MYSCFRCSVTFDSRVFKKSNRIKCPPMRWLCKDHTGETSCSSFVKYFALRGTFHAGTTKGGKREVGECAISDESEFPFPGSAGSGLHTLPNAPSILPGSLLGYVYTWTEGRNIKSPIELLTPYLGA